MADSDDVVITIPDEPADVTITPAAPSTAEAAALAKPDETIKVEKASEKVEKKPEKTDAPEEGIAALRAQLRKEQEESKARVDAERKRGEEAIAREIAARQEAERRAMQEAGRAQRSEADAYQGYYDSISSALVAAQQQQEALQQRLPDLYDKSDWVGVTKLQVEIANIAAKRAQLESGKFEIEQQRKQQQNQPAPQAPQPPNWQAAWNQNEFDQYIASRTAKTAAWLRRNDRFASDPIFRKRVAAVDEYTTTVLGLARDTDEYFARVEQELGMRAAPAATETPVEKAAPTSSAAQATPRSSPTPAAPPSRSTPTGTTSTNNNGRTVTLTQQEREMARQLFPKQKPNDPDPELVYARNKLALLAENRIGPNARDGR